MHLLQCTNVVLLQNRVQLVGPFLVKPIVLMGLRIRHICSEEFIKPKPVFLNIALNVTLDSFIYSCTQDDISNLYHFVDKPSNVGFTLRIINM